MYIWYIHDTRFTVYGIYGAQFILFRSFELRAKPSRVNEPANNRQQNLENASSTSIPTVTVMRTHVIYIRLMLYNIMYIHMSIKRVFTMLCICVWRERKNKSRIPSQYYTPDNESCRLYRVIEKTNVHRVVALPTGV